jgi:hypothetical protein
MGISTADAIRTLAGVITPLNAIMGHDANGWAVGSLTEAVMGVTGGLVRIANALESIAEAIREGRDEP